MTLDHLTPRVSQPDDEDVATVPPEFGGNFTDAWVNYDPEADKLIPIHVRARVTLL